MLLKKFQINSDVTLFAQEKIKMSSENVQPYIICSTSGSICNYFIQGDGWIIHRSDRTNFVSSFDLLFKIYHVLNLNYPPSLKNFYNLVEMLIYQIPGAVMPSVSSTFALIVGVYKERVFEESLMKDEDFESD